MAETGNDLFEIRPGPPGPGEPISEQVCWDNPAAQEVAMPLFNADINVSAITWRRGYSSSKFHWNNIHRLLLPLQGEFEVRLGSWDHCYAPKSGDIVYCPPGVGYYMKSNEAIFSQWMYFQISDTPFWEPLRQVGAFVKPYESATLVYLLLRRILDVHKSGERSAMGTARGDANMLANVIKRLRNHSPAHTPGPHTIALRKLLHDISHSPAEEWTQKRMTKRLNVSPSTLLRVCRQVYDMSPKDLIIQSRMTAAAELLIHGDDPLAMVAAKIGYQSVYSFSRLFRKVIGMPPGRFRRSQRNRTEAEEGERP